MDLMGIDGIDLFLAIQRRYEHHLAWAMVPGDDEEEDNHDSDGEDDDDGNKNGDYKKRRKMREAIAEARKKVANLIKRIGTRLMSANQLSTVDAPSGLFTDAQMPAAYHYSSPTTTSSRILPTGQGGNYLGPPLLEILPPGQAPMPLRCPRIWRADRPVYLGPTRSIIDNHCPRPPTAFTKAGEKQIKAKCWS